MLYRSKTGSSSRTVTVSHLCNSDLDSQTSLFGLTNSNFGSPKTKFFGTQSWNHLFEILPIPNLVNIQRTSFHYFIKQGLIDTIAKHNPLIFSNFNEEFEITFFPEWIQFRKPDYKPKQALRLGKTYGCSISIPVVIKTPFSNEQKLEWILLGFLPLMTKHGHFLINGIPRVVLHQMVRNPGVYIIAKDSRTRVPTIRIVPEQGSWINLTVDKKNRIWVTTRILKRKVSILIFLQALGLSLAEIYERLDHSELLQVSLIKALKPEQKTRHDTILLRAGLEGHPLTQEEAWKYLYAHYQEYSSQGREQPLNEEKSKEFFWNSIWNKKNRDLGILGRQQFRKKLASSVALTETRLTQEDLILATQALLDLIVGEKLPDDIDSLTNKRVRGCGEFLQDELSRGLREFDSVLTRKFNSTTTPQQDFLTLWRFNRAYLSKCISKYWKSFFTGGTLSQFMDQTNPLAELTHKRRLTVLGPGGVNSQQATIQIRGIHPTSYGRLCPIETPEGQNAGLVNSFTVYSQRNLQGYIETPFYSVYKGQVQKEIKPSSFLSDQETQNNVSPADLVVSKWGSLPKTDLPIRKHWKFEYASWKQISHQSIDILQVIAVATSLIPFLEHDDANRALMGSNMQRQAVPLLKPEVALVGTGLETRVISDVNHSIQASQTGYITSVSAKEIQTYHPNKQVLPKSKLLKIITKIKKITLSKKTEYFKRQNTGLFRKKNTVDFGKQLKDISKLNKFKIEKTLPLFPKYAVFWEPKDGVFSTDNSLYKLLFIQRLSRLDLFSSSKYFVSPFHLKQKQQHLNFLSNLRKGFFKSKKRTFLLGNKPNLQEFSFIHFTFSSKEIFKTPSFSSHVINYGEMKLCNSLDKRSSTTKSNLVVKERYFLDTYQRTNQSTLIFQRPAVFEKNWVQKADLLADGAASCHGKVALGKNVLIAYVPWEGYNYEDAILISQRLVIEDVYTSLHIDYYEIEVKNTQYGLEKITNKIPVAIDDPAKDILKLQRLNSQGLIGIGAWVEEGDYLVGKVSPISPKGPSIQQQYEKLYNVIMQRENTNLRNTSLRVPKGVEGFVLDVEILPPKEADVLALVEKNSILRVRIALLQRRKIQVGDKMAGRHGNKGIISKILPVQDMPYLPDGTPIDIVLNPLGVPSRMNVGQLLEALLGLAGNYLNESYTINLFDEKFGSEASRSFVYSKLYEASVKTGNPWLFEPSHPGKIKLSDGRTGKSFDQPITAGYAYMLKLVHLVDDKIHARSTGPYSAVTQQPVRGRSRNGGQRLGEMEVWALQAYGAASTLQELLTIKSDDVEGRKEAVFRIYTNQYFQFKQPESFKVLVRELQSLCFNLKIYGTPVEPLPPKSFDLRQLEKLGSSF